MPVAERINDPRSQPNPNVTFIHSLQDFDDHAEARKILDALAAQFKPICCDNHLFVTRLEEARFNREYGGKNWNGGECIEIVLRRRDGSFQPWGWLLHVMAHELAHCKEMNHASGFQKVNAQFRRDVQALRAKGYKGDGFYSAGTRLDQVGGIGNGVVEGDGELPEHTCAGAFKTTHQRSRKPQQVNASTSTSSPPAAAASRAPRGAAKPGVTGRQTAIPRKAGRRLASRTAFAYAGMGNVLSADPDMSTFRRRAGAVAAVAGRATAAEKRAREERRAARTADKGKGKKKEVRLVKGRLKNVDVGSSEEEGGGRKKAKIEMLELSSSDEDDEVNSDDDDGQSEYQNEDESEEELRHKPAQARSKGKGKKVVDLVEDDDDEEMVEESSEEEAGGKLRGVKVEDDDQDEAYLCADRENWAWELEHANDDNTSSDSNGQKSTALSFRKKSKSKVLFLPSPPSDSDSAPRKLARRHRLLVEQLQTLVDNLFARLDKKPESITSVLKDGSGRAKTLKHFADKHDVDEDDVVAVLLDHLIEKKAHSQEQKAVPSPVNKKVSHSKPELKPRPPANLPFPKVAVPLGPTRSGSALLQASFTSRAALPISERHRGMFERLRRELLASQKKDGPFFLEDEWKKSKEDEYHSYHGMGKKDARELVACVLEERNMNGRRARDEWWKEDVSSSSGNAVASSSGSRC